MLSIFNTYKTNKHSNQLKILTALIITFLFISSISSIQIVQVQVNVQQLSQQTIYDMLVSQNKIKTNQKINKYKPINYTQLNQDLQLLKIQIFLQKFQNIFTYQRIQAMNDNQAGNYLFLLGKMYIYNILPKTMKYQTKLDENLRQTEQQLKYQKRQYQYQQVEYKYQTKSNYLLGYFYLKIAAEVYQNADAHYYIAVLQYMKLTPTLLIRNNIKKLHKHLQRHQNKKTKSHLSSQQLDIKAHKILKQWQQKYLNINNNRKQQLLQILQDIIYDMQTHHLHNTQHHLYLAALNGQTPAKLSLAYMFKDGIGTQKNCSSAIAYYLSALKSTKIDTFQFPSDYSDLSNFQKQLYAHKKVNFKDYGEHDPSIWMETTMFDQETLRAYQDAAMNYLTGEQGFIVNQAKAAFMFQKMADISKLSRIMLAFMYLKGRGVQKDFVKARMLFQRQAANSKVAKQTLLVMKFYNLGFIGERQKALKAISQLYTQYERRMKKMQTSTINTAKQQAKPTTQNTQNTQNTPNTQNGQNNANNNPQNPKQAQKTQQQQQQQIKPSINRRQRIDIFRTPMMKYLVGSLLISQQIKGEKTYGIFLIDQSAKQGNTLALAQMGLIMLDGTDSSFDCQRSVNYFTTQALSHRSFQQRIQLAKLAIKQQKYMFAFIKYIQLMMVGYKNAFINALYLVEVYGKDLFQFNIHSWSILEAKNNQVYKILLKGQIVPKIESLLLVSFIPQDQQIFTQKNMQYLTNIQLQTQQQNTLIQSKQQQYPQQLKQYTDYVNLKITSIGIQKHEISILRFFKYKQTKDINILHRLANTAGQGNNPHILQSRFLLGKYYHHTNISGSSQEARHRRAIQEYNRATKSKFLAQFIYFIQGGQALQTQKITSHLLWYGTFIIAVGIFMYWKKNKKLEQILQAEQKKHQHENQQQNQNGDSMMFKFKEEENTQMNNKQENKTQTQQNKKQQYQSIFKKGFLNKKQQNIYKGPKFSEQQQQNLKFNRDLRNISDMMDQRKKNMENKHKLQQNNKYQLQQKEDKINQPTIIEETDKKDKID